MPMWGAMQPLVKSGGRAAQRVERERAGHVRRIDQHLGLAQGEESYGQHRLRAVHERQAFLGFER